ncbi:Fc.00g024290.m01.CDS01 [Cosmosporella sp. VM-42]
MKSKFGKWLLGKLDYLRNRDGRTAESEARELPYLPDHRPRVLTAVPSRVHELPTQRCIWFDEIPYDIRRDILIFAFGDRLLHMDISFRRPNAALSPGEPVPPTHCGINNTNHYGYGTPLKLDYGLPPAWHWWSSICHRNPYDLPAHKRAMSGDRGPIGPWNDLCAIDHTYTGNCDMWPGEIPFKCQVGAMGWLLTCRQAYTEGIEVLYRTNTFHMSSEVMIAHLPRLLLPQRLAIISSLEMIWTLKIKRSYGAGLCQYIFDEDHLNTVLNLLTSECPGLRRLYLSLQSSEDLADVEDILVSKNLLKQIDQLICNMPNLHECSIAVPKTAFHYLVASIRFKIRNTVAKEQIQTRNLPVNGSEVWRSLDGEFVLEDYLNSTYPKPPKCTSYPGNRARGSGYWILEGNNDEQMRGYRYCIMP